MGLARFIFNCGLIFLDCGFVFAVPVMAPLHMFILAILLSFSSYFRLFLFCFVLYLFFFCILLFILSVTFVYFQYAFVFGMLLRSHMCLLFIVHLSQVVVCKLKW